MTFMKNRFFQVFLILTFALLCLTGCAGKQGKLMKSAQANYQANDYEAALRDTVTVLKQKPNHVEAQNFVPIFFNAAVDVGQNRIKTLETTSDKFKWDEIVAEYNRLIEMNTLVQNLPPLTHKKTKQRITFETQDYSRQLAEASEKAAEAHYQEGIRLSASADDVETQKQTAKEFKTADTFVPGYKDAQSRYEQARSAGTKKIAILTVADESVNAHAYGVLRETITDNIIRIVLKDPEASEYLTIVSRYQLEQVMAAQDLSVTEQFDKQTVIDIGQALGVHEIVVVQMTQIDDTVPDTTSTTLNRQDTVRKKTGTKKTVDEDGNTKTESKYSDVTVTAKFTRHRRTSSASIIGSYRILDAQTATPKQSDNFIIEHQFVATWATYTGDKEALSKSESNELGNEKKAPAKEVMVFEASNKLSRELAEVLKAHVLGLIQLPL